MLCMITVKNHDAVLPNLFREIFITHNEYYTKHVCNINLIMQASTCIVLLLTLTSFNVSQTM